MFRGLESEHSGDKEEIFSDKLLFSTCSSSDFEWVSDANGFGTDEGSEIEKLQRV